jgi:hypothetical protein
MIVINLPNMNMQMDGTQMRVNNQNLAKLIIQ